METTYNVYFAGEILPGHQGDAVREALGRLFKAGDATLDKLFSGSLELIKRDCDKATALKYKQAMERAGAKPVIRRNEAGAAAAAPPAPQEPPRTLSMAERVAALAAGASAPVAAAPPATAPADATDASMSLAPAGADVLRPEERREHPVQEVDTSALSLAGTGARLSEAAPSPPPAPDTSHLSMGDVGEDIPTLARPAPPGEPDTSGISLCDAGGDFSDCAAAAPAAPALDLSAMELAPAGSGLLEERYRKPEAGAAPDTSHLSLDEPR
jgi:hypothetical protein